MQIMVVFPQEERKAQSLQVEQLPGVDFKLKILFTKVSCFMYV